MTSETRRWKAFLRLRGESLVETDDEILNEFEGFVHALRRVGVDYSIIVNVEGGRTEHLLGRTGQFGSKTPSLTPESKRYESSEAES
jgi:hypothetical protein